MKDEGGSGLLVSGGSLLDGHVPLEGFIDAIKRVKRDLDLKVVVHTGVVDRWLVEGLASANVDCVMIDVVGSDDTIREVLHLNRSVEDYARSLELLEEHGIPSAPHVVVGLHKGRLKGEGNVLKIISERNVAVIVVVVLMPLEGTPMEKYPPPSVKDVLRVILATRLANPTTPLLLGCARPRGRYKAALDVLAVRAGVNGVAYPSVEGYRAAVKRKLSVRFHDECCSLLWKEVLA